MKPKSKTKQMPENLVIGKDRLFTIIEEYRQGIRSEHGWPAPFGILISVVLCLVATENFQPVFFLTADQSQLIVYLLGAFSGLWFLRALWKTTQGNAKIKFESEIAANIKNPPDFTAIYIIKLTSDQIPRLLVEWKDSWECYFLPYVARQQEDDFSLESQSSLKKTVACYLGVSSEDVVIDHLQGYSLSSDKYSPTEEAKKRYNFDFFFFSIPKKSMLPSYESSPFKVGGKTYYWKTIDELMNDQKTMERNGDVVEHLNKYYSTLLVQTGDSFK